MADLTLERIAELERLRAESDAALYRAFASRSAVDNVAHENANLALYAALIPDLPGLLALARRALGQPAPTGEVAREHREAAKRLVREVESRVRGAVRFDFKEVTVDVEHALSLISAARASLNQGAEPVAGWAAVSEGNLPDTDIEVLAATADNTLALVRLDITDDSEGHGVPYWTNGSDDFPLYRFARWGHINLPEPTNGR